jgi:pimeloyl-ACP methyl ester carboxylesterase
MAHWRNVMHETMIGDLRITYERAGEGSPLVLLHGAFGFDSCSWRRQLDALSDEFTVVAWDAPGCGQSTDPPETFRSSDYADCLAAFIEALGLGRPHLLGLSFGGVLTLDFYRRYPTIPRTLILDSAYAGWAGRCRPRRSSNVSSTSRERSICRPSSGLRTAGSLSNCRA